MNLKPAISEEAFRHGFSALGVASADYDPVGHSRLLQWLARNYHADMRYLERSTRKRFDPKIHLPHAKSVIICSLNYYIKPDNDPAKPYISIYARGENYHDVMKRKLDLLCQKIVELSGERAFKVTVDSSAFAEKAFAAKAGLGFIGRNGLLILTRKNAERRASGSFHFLGAIITDLELEPDSLCEGSCGACRICSETCPTNAIIADGVIDSTRCISYQTTQNKAEIPEEISMALDNNIFGCDICQTVCPFNQKSNETTESRLHCQPEMRIIDIESLSKIDADEFRRRFAKSSIGELKYELFMRNMAIAVENIRARR
jgi:epoxyqueuosine reductase